MAGFAAQPFIDELVRAGVVHANDLDRILDITIKIEPGEIVTMTVRYVADDGLLTAFGRQRWVYAGSEPVR